MINHCLLFLALFLADGVFDVSADDKVIVSVIKGDSVTLNPDTGIPDGDTVEWWFGVKIIASMNKGFGLFSTSEGDSVGFKDRLELDKQNGSLTIMNITPEDSGLYQRKIKSTIEEIKEFNVSVRGEMKTISVMEGEPITLYTVLTLGKKRYDLISCKFKDHVIAEISEEFLPYDSRAGGRFKGRLQLHPETGSFYISDSRSTDSGVYHLEMNSSSHTVQRNIDVTVKNSGLSSAAVAGTVGVLLLLIFAAGFVVGWIYHRKKISEPQSSNDAAEPKESIKPLTSGSANGEGS